MARELDQHQMALAADPAIVNVQVPLDLLWDFDGLMALKRNILNTLGCQACTSGYDIRWRGVRDTTREVTRDAARDAAAVGAPVDELRG